MIHLTEAGKQFNNRWLFRNLSLSVQKGRSIVLLGPSGSGKSVLLKAIAGLITLDEGQIKLESENIGMLFQKNALFDSLTVKQNLSFPLKERLMLQKEEADERIRQFLLSVGLEGTEKLYPDELSGGMQKRLAIARALIVEPQIILYDEPTAGLDPITSKKIADLVLEFKKRMGCTIFTITTDVMRAFQLADEIFLLANGELLQGGTPKQVKDSKHPAIEQFIKGLRVGPLTSEFA